MSRNFHKETNVYAVSIEQAESASGGLPWSTPALVALADSASLGPLAWSFGLGYVIGTAIYHIAFD